MLGFAAANAAAQKPCDDADGIAAVDAKIRSNYGKIATLEIALEAAKEYLQKYGECETTKDFVAWVKPLVPKWEQGVAKYKDDVWRTERVKKFDDAIQNKKFDDVYTVGAQLIQRYPDNVHYLLPLGLIGLSESYKNNYKYNDDSIRYAKLALAKFKSGTPEPKRDKEGKLLLDANGKELFGPYQFERNKENAISELTYALAHILYHAKKDKRAGLLYYYEVSQTPGPYKEEPRLYATIGQYYVEESAPIGKEIVSLIQKEHTALTDEEKEKLDVEIKAKEALYNGYNERALDAFSRAYRFADEKIASEKTLKAQVYTALQGLFERRFAKKDGVDKWVADATVKPFPNPTSEVTPVSDPEPAKVTVGAPDTAKPASTPGAAKGKPAATKGKPAKPRR